ncbi:MAG: zinc ribbon domain-containing protein [Bryobacteraceae bacterium]
MRYCNQCHRITAGEPLFCNFCGASYDVKLCPSRHINPRSAEVCATCGSRDLSTPAPPLPVWARAALWLLTYVPGVVLLLLSLFLLTQAIQEFLHDARLQGQVMILILMLGIFWYIYIQIPAFIRSLFKTIWGKAKPKKERPH